MKILANLKLFSVLSVIFLGLLSSSVLQADDAADIVKIKAELSKILGSGDVQIEKTAADGVYQVLIQGNYAYAYVDGDYALIGDLFNTKEKINLGEVAASARMSAMIDSVPTDKMIVYGPEKPKRHITIFTDIDCGYCQKLHREIPQLNAAGVEVRYLAYPRAGLSSKSYDKYVSVWCNKDQQAALTAAKAGKAIDSATCENPISESFNLGREVGVRGTPTMIFDDGTVVPGYVQYKQLIQRLGLEEEG